MLDVIIIGCGIVGATVAYELSKYNVSVAVLEKNNDVAMGATKANSAIIHAGYSSKPGSLMAELNVEGARLAKELFEKLDVPFRQCGSFVLAFSEQEIPELERLLRNGESNSVPGVRIIDRETVLNMEPNISKDVIAALYAPSAMIVSPWEYALALIETAVRNGVDLQLERAVTGIEKTNGAYKLRASGVEYEARCVVNAAGLYSDEIHNMVAEPLFQIMPVKGEYFLLDKSEGAHINHVIFQCPTAAGKGVLIAPTVHGNLIVGPSSERITDREDVSTTANGLEFVMRSALLAAPGIDFRTNVRSFAGNRARSEYSDFIISEAARGFIDLAGICSPGLSAAPAIAKRAVRLLANNGLDLTIKQDYVDKRSRIRFHALTSGEKAELVARDPAYGRVVCRCETVTEGEVRDALRAPVPPRSADAVKRRAGAGMGRCQAGFCGPRVLEMLAGHYRCQLTDVPQDESGSFVLLERIGR